MFPCFFSFLLVYGARSTSDGCLFCLFLRAKREAWVLRPQVIISRPTGWDCTEVLNHESIGTLEFFFYTPQEHESARAFLVDRPLV